MYIDDSGVFESIFKKENEQYKIRHFAEYASFCKQLSTLFLIRLYQHATVQAKNRSDVESIISKKQQRTIDVLAMIQELFKAGNLITKKEAEKKINELLKREKITGLQKNSAWLLLQTFYNLELQANRREYKVCGMLELAEFFQKNKLDFSHTDEQIRQVIADLAAAKNALENTFAACPF